MKKRHIRRTTKKKEFWVELEMTGGVYWDGIVSAASVSSAIAAAVKIIKPYHDVDREWINANATELKNAKPQNLVFFILGDI